MLACQNLRFACLVSTNRSDIKKPRDVYNYVRDVFALNTSMASEFAISFSSLNYNPNKVKLLRTHNPK